MVCKVIFLSNPTYVKLDTIESWLSWGCGNCIWSMLGGQDLLKNIMFEGMLFSGYLLVITCPSLPCDNPGNITQT